MNTRGLRHYLDQKAASMQAAAAAKPAGADWHDTVEATVTAGDATGVRRLRIRDWEILGDSGPAFGGYALGPSSPELLCGVLGTCLTHTYLIGAANMGIPLDHVQVRVTAQNNDAGFLGIPTADPAVPWNITAHIEVLADAVEVSRLATLHRYVSENCPLTNLLRRGCEITLVTG